MRRLARRRRQTIELHPRPIRRNPALGPAAVLWGLAGLIVVGAGLLMLPVAARDGRETDLLTALFTATSAACTTGLVVVDTHDHWSTFGQGVIVLLMQAGGLGFLTSSTLLLLLIGRRLTLEEQVLVQESIGEGTLGNVARLVRRIVAFALVVEAAGALLLTITFLRSESPGRALWHGVFYAVSAFTNASFDLFGGFRSLTGRADNSFFLLVIAVLIVTGGLSYAVVADVAAKRRFSRLLLDSKLVLVVTAALLLLGTAAVYLLERANGATLGGMSVARALEQSAFLSVAARTSGFATLSIGALGDETLFLLCALMFIGGAAGSTAGGIKVNAFGLLVAAVLSASRGQTRVIVFRREVPLSVVLRALSVAVLSALVVFSATLALAISEPFAFDALLFETTSAFGTVGLSTGITHELSTVGKLTLIATMFIGRIGPLAFAYALARRQRPELLGYPQDTVRIG